MDRFFFSELYEVMLASDCIIVSNEVTLLPSTTWSPRCMYSPIHALCQYKQDNTDANTSKMMRAYAFFQITAMLK